METIASCVLRPVSRPSVILLLLLHNALPQMFERIKVVENSPMNTVILDIRSVFLRQGGEPLQTNASVFASEQQTFWPFVIDNFVIRLVGPLDREAICVQQSASHRLESVPGSVSLMSTPGPPTHTANQYSCTPGVCCQLLHVNILLSPTALPKDFFILVEVEDMNDNPPRFSPLNSPYAIVREDVSVGHRIWLPKAFDLDSDQYSVLEYRIENWIRGNHTHLNLGVEQNEYWKSAKDGIFFSSSRSSMPYAISARPYLTPVVPLDREHCDVYSFTLIAVDGGVQDTVNPDLPNRALTGSVNIDIHLEDVNDNAPLFDSDMYNAKLVENVVTVNVFEFEVVDKDIGNNGRIKVSIHDHSGYAQRLFRVGLQTVSRSFFHGSSASLTNQSNNPKESHFRGFLQLIGQVDAERFPAILHFKLIATDFGQQALSSTAEVQIQIINVNDNAPSIAFFSRGKRLSDGRISLPEVETPARSLVALMHVTDGDSPLAQLRCQLVQEADTFTLEEVRGSGFQSMHRENFMYESAVEPHGIVSRYRQFAIRTRTILNREIKNLYIIVVECTDSDDSVALTKNASLHLTVLDVNDNSPVFDRPEYIASVVENSAAAELRFLSPMRVTDEDEGPNAQLTFKIFQLEDDGTHSADMGHQTNDSLRFRIEHRSGRIWTTFALDCETKNEYHLLLVVSDSGRPQPRSSSATIHVNVEDLNDNIPEFISSHYQFEVTENAPGGTVIGRVDAIDRDVSEANQRSRYGLRGRAEDLHLIAIDRRTGVLQTRRPIDRESISSISLTVLAENEVPVRGLPNGVSMPDARDPQHNIEPNQTAVATATVMINILNVNDNRPEFVAVEPHTSHVAFVWEHLNTISTGLTNSDSSTTHRSTSVQQSGSEDKSTEVITNSKTNQVNPVCERLPYRVIDRDLEPDNYNECCVVELLLDYDGLFSLMPETGNIICVMRRPPAPKTYKLTLLAKDGLTNDSLSAQIHFTVVIRSDPNLRALERFQSQGQVARRLTDFDPDLTKSKLAIKYPGRLDADSSTVTSAYGMKLSEFGTLERARPHPSIGTVGQINSAQSAHHSVVIVVMSTVGGIFCVLLLIAMLFTKRFVLEAKAPCTKEEPDVPLEGPVEEHSVTSGSQLYPLTALAGPYTVDHQRHRSGEPVYHPSYDVNEHAYGLTPHTPISESGCASPSVSYNTMTYWQPERRKIAKFTELPPKKQSDKSGNEMSVLAVLPDDKLSNNECARNASCYLPPTRINKKRQPSSEWPPPHQGNNVVDYMRLMGQTRSTLKENSMSKFLAKSSLNSPSNLYQSIEFRVALDSGVPRKCDTGGSAFTPPELSHVPKLTKKQIYNRTESEMGSNCKRRGADPEINYSSPVKGLHRANSDRTGYVQTSFV